MMLPAVIAIPLLGGVLAWFSGRWGRRMPPLVSISVLALDCALLVLIWCKRGSAELPAAGGAYFLEWKQAWVQGISCHFALDGLSWLLCLLTAVMGAVAVIVSSKEVREHDGFFYFNLLAVLSGILGVFLALDLVIFFFFWELMLVPVYFLMVIWGRDGGRRAALKFFIFTQASGLLMLLSIVALHVLQKQVNGIDSFDCTDFVGHALPPTASLLVMLGFCAAFAVKLPIVPFHTWLPDAYAEAPTAGSVILAGLLAKTAAYGFLRFVLPLFPEDSVRLAPIGLVLGAAGIIYGAVLALGQSDFKRLIAYSSISHMGFVLLGICALNQAALQGVVIQMIAHALATGGLFIAAGYVTARFHTDELRRLGGLMDATPRLAGAVLFFAVATLGLPGTGNFAGEFLILFGCFRANAGVAVAACAGVVLSCVYALWLVQRVVHGPRADGSSTVPDLSRGETALMLALAALSVCIGLYPQPIADAAQPALAHLAELVRTAGGFR
jgi:NADH-quinone oxidoreductase subunit M